VLAVSNKIYASRINDLNFILFCNRSFKHFTSRDTIINYKIILFIALCDLHRLHLPGKYDYKEAQYWYKNWRNLMREARRH